MRRPEDSGERFWWGEVPKDRDCVDGGPEDV